MSQFDQFNAAAWGEAAGVFGTSPCVIDGNTYAGILDANDASTKLHEDGGGEDPEYVATLMIENSLLAALPDPVEQHLQDKQVLVQGRRYKVGRAVVDSVNATLFLISPRSR